MLISLSVIMLSGLFFGWLCKKIHFPSLFGMIIAGIIIGPYALNLIDTSVLDISTEIRRIALIIILIRAGLKLDVSVIAILLTAPLGAFGIDLTYRKYLSK